MSDEKVVSITVELGVDLVSFEDMIGRPDAVEEVLTVVENDDVRDVGFISTLVVDNVTLKCIVGSDVKKSVNAVFEDGVAVFVEAVNDAVKSVDDM